MGGEFSIPYPTIWCGPFMVDREARDNLTELLRRYQDGEINGEMLLSSVPRSQDSAISGITERYWILLIGGGHRYAVKKLGHLKVTELSSQAYVTQMTDRAILFLGTDLEYRWRDYAIWADPTMIPFHCLAFVVAVPLTSAVAISLGEAIHGVGESIGAILMIAMLVPVTLIGGSRLRSLITGIDRLVWPFYRRQEHRDAIACWESRISKRL